VREGFSDGNRSLATASARCFGGLFWDLVIQHSVTAKYTEKVGFQTSWLGDSLHRWFSNHNLSRGTCPMLDVPTFPLMDKQDSNGAFC